MKPRSNKARSNKPRSKRKRPIRALLVVGFLLALAAAQVRESLRPDYAAQLEVVVQRADTGETVPARIYLFKGDRPFRLSPVDAFLPLRSDLFYRERLWSNTPNPKTLEITALDKSHFILLEGAATFDLPASADYRIEAYHGTFFKPAVTTFSLSADEKRRIVLKVEPIAPARQDDWLAADDHIHLMRGKQDDAVFLKWLEAEDLAVGNFLELQRQQHAALQYAFGRQGEARLPGYAIRSGHESRSNFYGHTMFLGPDKMVRPLSVGSIYANSPEAYPFPALLFEQGRKLGGIVGFAHFYGSQPNSTLIMNLARNKIDFVELLQFGQLQTEPWYELLNAGFRVVGNAGSDFPANLPRLDPYPRAIPLLGPERALVKAPAGDSAYDAWAEGIRKGAAVVSNGPLLEFSAGQKTSGEVVSWQGAEKVIRGAATATFYRPIQKLEIVVNGKVVASQSGDGARTELSLTFDLVLERSSWVAARAKAENIEDEPDIRAHTNPVYFLKEGDPVHIAADRQSVRIRWEKEAAYYSSSSLIFAEPNHRAELLTRVEETRKILANPQPPWN